MIERVAQTLHDLTMRNSGTARDPADMYEDAVALIATMREPSVEMERAALYSESGDGAEVYRAMTDTALAGEE
jgi:hypothetical protein